MQIMRLWAHIRWSMVAAVAVTFLGWSAAMPAGAQPTATEGLPSSVRPPRGDWEQMTPSSFRGTVEDALRQCNRNAAVSATDVLTPTKCERFGTQLQSGTQCQVVQVPDGVVFDILNGLRHGQSHMWFGMRKQLGRHDQAVLCDVGDGVWAYWFTGIPNQSCNNVAFVLLPQTAATAPTENCRLVKHERRQLPNTFTSVPAMYSCGGCYMPGFTGVIDGGEQTSSRMVCEDE